MNNKTFVVLLSVLSLFFTLLFVKYIKNHSTTDDKTLTPFYYEALQGGRSAVSVLFRTENLPVDLIYPGVKVDVVEAETDDIKYLVKNVFIVAVSFMEDKETVKVDLALNEMESKRIILSKALNIKLLVKGLDDKDDNLLEITEL